MGFRGTGTTGRRANGLAGWRACLLEGSIPARATLLTRPLFAMDNGCGLSIITTVPLDKSDAVVPSSSTIH